VAQEWNQPPRGGPGRSRRSLRGPIGRDRPAPLHQRVPDFHPTTAPATVFPGNRDDSPHFSRRAVLACGKDPTRCRFSCRPGHASLAHYSRKERKDPISDWLPDIPTKSIGFHESTPLRRGPSPLNGPHFLPSSLLDLSTPPPPAILILRTNSPGRYLHRHSFLRLVDDPTGRCAVEPKF